MALVRAKLLDASGTVTTGGTNVTPLAADPTFTRDYLFIQNNSSAVLWVNFDTAAVASQPSMQLAAGAYFEWGKDDGFVPIGQVNILGATTGQAFTIKYH